MELRGRLHVRHSVVTEVFVRCFTFIVLLLAGAAARPAEAQTRGTITGSVTNAETGLPIAGVSILVGDSRAATVTRQAGRYQLTLDVGRHELRARLLGYAAEVRTVIVRAGETSTHDFVLTPGALLLHEIIATGTRGTDRTALRSPVPVDVISSTDMQNTGQVETWQMLQRLVPSLNVPHLPLGDDLIRPLTLRGMGPDQLLVLVDGKRRHSAAIVQGGPALNGNTAVDINAIPSNAIDRVELLRDGAAAQYGSDAIAGVVNIILKSQVEPTMRLSAGRVASTEGGRSHRDGEVVNLNASYGVRDQNGAHLTLHGEYRDRGFTNRAYPDMREQYFTGDPRNANAPVINSHQGNGAVRDLGFFANGLTPLRSSAELYGSGGATRRDGRARTVFRRASDSRTVRSLHPDGFLPEVGSDILDYSALVGLRGRSGAWHWDVSSLVGGNTLRTTVHNSNNVSLGEHSPTEFEIGVLRARQWTSNADVSRSLHAGLRSPVNLAFGAEVRRDKFVREAGEPDSYRDGGVRILDGPAAGELAPIGAQGNAGIRPVDEVNTRRNNLAAYVQLDGDITRRLLVDIAARVERYSDFGSTVNGRIAGRYDLFRGVSIRGAGGNGFRAPSLTQSFHSTTTGQLRAVNGVNTLRTIRTLPVHSAEAQILGASPLRAETSRNFSAGLVMRANKLILTADHYAIDVEDRIVPSGIFEGAAISKLFEDHGLRGIDGGRYYTNAIDTRTRGTDVVAQYALTVGKGGRLQFTGGYNETRTRVTRVTATPPQLAAFQSTLFGRADRGKVEVGQPRNTTSLAVNFTWGRAGLNLNERRFGSTSLLDVSDPERDQTVSARWIADVNASYRLRGRLHVSASATNLFDVYPDEWRDYDRGVNGVLSMNGTSRYSGIAPFGINGRTVYLTASYR